jgi:small subunit ribosomal protein S6
MAAIPCSLERPRRGRASKPGLGRLESRGGHMRSYEALVIVDASLEEGDIQKAVDRFSTVITDNGGEVTNVDRWGLRRFAYEIAHKNEGYYFLANFAAPEDAIANLERTVRISDEYIRGKIIRPE